MPVGEMLKRVSSSEIVEWAAELKMRNDDEREAYEQLQRDDDGIPLDEDGKPVIDEDEIVRIARQRGHLGGE